MNASEEVTEELIGPDAVTVRKLIFELDHCARYIEVTALPPKLPGSRWYSGRYLSSNGNLAHLIVVMDAKSGEVVATYAGVSMMGQ